MLIYIFACLTLNALSFPSPGITGPIDIPSSRLDLDTFQISLSSLGKCSAPFITHDYDDTVIEWSNVEEFQDDIFNLKSTFKDSWLLIAMKSNSYKNYQVGVLECIKSVLELCDRTVKLDSGGAGRLRGSDEDGMWSCVADIYVG